MRIPWALLLLFFCATEVFARGGGGCFPGDVTVLTADGGGVPISSLRAGDRVLAFTPEGRLVPAVIEEVLALTRDSVLELATAKGSVRATDEHPFFIGGGSFKTAAELKPGDVLYVSDGKSLVPAPISSIRRIVGPFTVYNLKTEAPNTFFADGFAVHNKGGGGGGGGGGHGGGGGGDFTSLCNAMSLEDSSRGVCLTIAHVCNGIVAVIMLIFMGIAFFGELSGHSGGGEDLDYCFSVSKVGAKADPTHRLLQFLAKTDPAADPDALESAVQAVFIQLQRCWEDREYAPMQPLLMPDLYAQHCSQLASMKTSHEINRITGLEVQWVRIVHVRWMNLSDNSQVTALIQAKARDYYVDDRDGTILRGDEGPATFQEFWTFQRQGNRWLLREIDQTKESDALREANFVEAFTPDQLAQASGLEAGPPTATAPTASGPVGPSRSSALDTKDTRIQRMLNFLSQSDPLWDEDTMKDQARTACVAMYGFLERGNEGLFKDRAFPALLQSVAAVFQQRQAGGGQIQYRNFCVRKVDILLVRNFADQGKDEFTARIAAHSQRVQMQNGAVTFQDPDVRPFEAYYTFGRLDGRWKLKEILPPAAGAQAESAENVDETVSPDELQWYYTKERA